MNLKWKRILLVAVMLTSLKVSANEIPEVLVLQKNEQTELAKYIKQCEVDKKNLNSYQGAYQVCMDRKVLSPEWWQTPAGAAGLVVLGMVITAVVVK